MTFLLHTDAAGQVIQPGDAVAYAVRDGDSENNSLDNLMMLCPNCHTQTGNYGSKNTRRVA